MSKTVYLTDAADANLELIACLTGLTKAKVMSSLLEAIDTSDPTGVIDQFTAVHRSKHCRRAAPAELFK